MKIDVERFQQARQVRRLSRENLASRIGVSEYAIWQFEREGGSLLEDALGTALLILGFPLRFYKRPVVEFPYQFSSLALHISPKDLCYQCNKSLEALCDYPVGDGKRCDLALCDDHRIRVNAEIDYCYQHSESFPVLEGQA